ncbi:MAG: hypothetical protein DRJ05_00600 [Bacteroidetes bacterium]|nr:MAG: hypothetical protein DRJ05_00600 [Bacteroidota bacterium]
MIGAVKNVDIIYFQFRKQNYPETNPLQKELNNLLDEIRSGLVSVKPIKKHIDKNIARIFDFRVKAFKWFLNNKEFSFDNSINDIYIEIEKYNLEPKLQVLSENLLFALRCNLRVVNALFNSESSSEEKIEKQALKSPTINYDQFVTSIALGVPDDQTAQKIIDWTNSSLYIEYIALAVSLIYDKKLHVPPETINDLAFLVADASQLYFAISTEMGLIKQLTQKFTSSELIFDENFMEEQKQIAEMGIGDYGKSLFSF